MKLLSRLLFVPEFGPGDAPALQTIEALARRFQSQVMLAHPISGDFDPPRRKHHLGETAINRLLTIADDLTQRGISVGGEEVLYGPAIDEIVAHATSEEVNVIVVPVEAGAAGPGARALSLMRRAATPVWAVRPEQAGAPRRILCPVKGSRSCERALRNAVHLARQFEARLDVMTVEDPAAEAPERAARTLLKDMLDRQDVTDVDLHETVRLGRPDAEILAARETLGNDLLVMGSAGRTRLMALLLGSVAARVLAAAPCSVVTLRAEEAVRLERDVKLGDASHYLNRGRQLLAHGFPREAIEELELALDLDVALAEAWEAKAEAHRRLTQQRQARRALGIVGILRRSQPVPTGHAGPAGRESRSAPSD